MNPMQQHHDLVGQMVERHAPAVRNRLRAAFPGYPEDCLDAAQEALRVALEKKDMLKDRYQDLERQGPGDGDGWFGRYLHATARGHMLRTIRERPVSADLTEHDVASGVPGPGQTAAAREALSKVEAAARKMGQKYLTVLVHTALGSGGQQLAEALGVPKNTIYTQTRRVRASLQVIAADFFDGPDGNFAGDDDAVNVEILARHGTGFAPLGHAAADSLRWHADGFLRGTLHAPAAKAADLANGPFGAAAVLRARGRPGLAAVSDPFVTEWSQTGDSCSATLFAYMGSPPWPHATRDGLAVPDGRLAILLAR